MSDERPANENGPAAQLRAAAERLREHVDYLSLHGVRGPWAVHAGSSGYPQEISNIGVPILVANTFTNPKAPPVMANYIALMHPGVGLALAEWLENTAAEIDTVAGTEYEACGLECDFPSWQSALTVARRLDLKVKAD